MVSLDVWCNALERSRMDPAAIGGRYESEWPWEHLFYILRSCIHGFGLDSGIAVGLRGDFG